MDTYKFIVTRNCEMTQSREVEVKAGSLEEARELAEEAAQDSGEECLTEWTDDDAFYPGDAYLGDPDHYWLNDEEHGE